MKKDARSLRVLQEGISLKEVFNVDFLKKLEENFENLEVILQAQNRVYEEELQKFRSVGV